jgi:hypothetical protein
MRNEEIPPYAILSHTWDGEEVSYKEMRKDSAVAKLKRGYRKIKFCAEHRLVDDIGYCWVDTCCSTIFERRAH